MASAIYLYAQDNGDDIMGEEVLGNCLSLCVESLKVMLTAFYNLMNVFADIPKEVFIRYIFDN
jgi:hypothetical protein